MWKVYPRRSTSELLPAVLLAFRTCLELGSVYPPYVGQFLVDALLFEFSRASIPEVCDERNQSCPRVSFGPLFVGMPSCTSHRGHVARLLPAEEASTSPRCHLGSDRGRHAGGSRRRGGWAVPTW